MIRLVVVAALVLMVALVERPRAEHVNAGVTTDFTLSLDCDKAAAGIQSACTIPSGPLRDVDVVLTNNTATPRELNGFSFEVHDPDTTRLNPPPIGCGPPCHSANPDPDQAALGLDFSCAPPPPDNDTGEDGPGTSVSFLNCFNAVLTGPSIPAGGSIVLGFVRYAVPTSAASGTVALSLADAVAMEDGSTELGSCAPVVTTTMTCAGANVTIAPLSVLIDCSLSAPGVQTVCHVSNMSSTRDVSVTIRNNSNAAWTLDPFTFTLVHLDDTRLFAPQNLYQLDGNPDFTADPMPTDYACDGVFYPDNDRQDPFPGPTAPGQRSWITCFVGNGGPGLPSIAAGALLPLATVHYNIVSGADPGSVVLSLEDTGVADSTFDERGSCNPVSTSPPGVPAHCPTTELIFNRPIDQADVNNDGRVNSIDLGITASNFFNPPPPPAHIDQNFDGVLNSIDLGLIASHFNKFVTACP